MTPLLTQSVHEELLAAARAGASSVECSLDLQRSRTHVALGSAAWTWNGRDFPYLQRCKERTVYYWTGAAFEPVARYSSSLIKLVPTDWGPPTFEIDGIKMLPSAHVSPYEDAKRKVALIQPANRIVLDTCGGLGYFAACLLEGGAARVHSYELNPDVVWLRSINSWSPAPDPRLNFVLGDVSAGIADLTDACVDAILHDPPRFGIAGELYSQQFYEQLARVLRRHGRLFHYIGTPNKLTSGRDVPREVARRLQRAGFRTEPREDGLLAIRG